MQRNLKRNFGLFRGVFTVFGLLMSSSVFALCGSGVRAYITHTDFYLYNWASSAPNVSVYGLVSTRTDTKHGLIQRSTGGLISPNPNPASPLRIPFGGSSTIIDSSMGPVAVDCYHVDIDGSATTYYSLAFLVSDATADAQNPNLFLTTTQHQISQDLSGTYDRYYYLSLRESWMVDPVTTCSGSTGSTVGCAVLPQSSLLSNSTWVRDGNFIDLGSFPYVVSSPSSVLQPGLSNSSATQLLWPSTLKMNAINNFYGVANFGVTVPIPQSDDSSTITTNFGLVCENITGVGNTCPWFGVDDQGSRPQLTPLS